MTSAEKKAIYAALAAPFPEHCIQRTEGRLTGRGYDTTGIGYQHIANRLNEVLGVGGWRAHRTVTVKEIVRSNGRPAFEAICDITLELGEWLGGEFVVFAESLADGGHLASSEADARKGAYTNSFKKAAAFFGVGRQAYEGSLDDDNLPTEHEAETVVQQVAPPRPALAVVPSPVARQIQQPRNRITSKQVSAIWAIGRKLGHDQSSLRQFVKTTFGVQAEYLSREQASQLISTLSQQVAAATGNGEDTDSHHPGQEG